MALIEQWQERLEKLSDEALDGLTRATELGELNFGSTVAKLRAIRQVVEALSQEDPRELPSQLPTQVAQQLDQVLIYVDQMRSFTLAQDQASTTRSNLDTNVENLKEWFLKEVRPHLRGRAVDVSATAAELQSIMQKARTTASEADALINKLRQAAGEAGATELSSHYRTQAENHSTQADRFLKATIGGVVGTAILGFVLFVIVPPPVGSADQGHWGEFVREVLIRLFFLGIATSVVAFLVRNYRINKHLEISNQEKRNALNTYPLFREAATTDEAQDLVTAQLASAVFGHTDTGFLSGSHDKTIIENVPGVTGLLQPRSPSL